MKKYFILSRSADPDIIFGGNYYTLSACIEEFEKVEDFINSNPRMEHKVILGKELEWDIEIEEVVRTEKIIKSKKIKRD